MFGQKDDKEKHAHDESVADPMQAVTDSTTQLLATDPAASDNLNDGPPAIASAATAPPTDTAWQHPGTPIDESENDTDTIRDVISPAGGYPSAPSNRIRTGSDADEESDSVSNNGPASISALVSDDDVTDAQLIEIKQKALSELVPLIDKLDQPPEEKFRTIMMMIQASDDERLVEKAYETAHLIEVEEARAQALLDIVNEINYFTQPHENH